MIDTAIPLDDLDAKVGKTMNHDDKQLALLPDPPFTIGPHTMASGFKRISKRQQVTLFIWPSNDAPDAASGLGYFYLAALYDDLHLVKHGKREGWEVIASSVDGTKKPIRRDGALRMAERMSRSYWRELEWTSEEVEPIDHNFFLYGSREEWFEREVLGIDR
jgi:hypothetical protein